MKLNYLIIPLITFCTAFWGSIITAQGMAWYKTIKTPSWTPKGGVIGAVWTILFICAAISALIVWNGSAHAGIFWTIIVIFIANAFLNVLWTWLFFGQHRFYSAIWEALCLDVTVVILIQLIVPRSELAAVLLVPYAAWVTFAAYLTYRIWQLNTAPLVKRR